MANLGSIDNLEHAYWDEETTVARTPPRPSAGVEQSRALLIGSVARDAAIVGRALRALALQTTWARRGAEGVAAARVSAYELVLVDRELPDMSGLDVVRTLRAKHERLRCVLLNRRPSMSAADARALGLAGIVEKPFGSADVITAISGIVATSDMDHEADPESSANHEIVDEAVSCTPRATAGSVAERWALRVLRTIDAERDPKTVQSWAQALGVSRSVLAECCRLVHIPPHNGRDFARLLRAICRSGDLWQPETTLDLGDTRTLRKKMARSGFSESVVRTPSVDEFLRRQQWIPSDNPGLRALRSLLYGRGV